MLAFPSGVPWPHLHHHVQERAGQCRALPEPSLEDVEDRQDRSLAARAAPQGCPGDGVPALPVPPLEAGQGKGLLRAEVPVERRLGHP